MKYFLALLFALLLTPLCQAQDVVDGIAAIVNDDVITFSEVKSQVDQQEKSLREALPEGGEELAKRIKALRLDALKALIERQLIVQEFKKQSFTFPDKEIDKRVAEIINNQYDGNRAAFVKTLQAQNMTIEEFRRDLKKQMIVYQMRYFNVNKDIVISPYKIEKFYQENADSFYQQDQIKMRMIHFKKGLFTEKEQDKNGKENTYDPQKRLADDIVRKLNTGSDFGSLASIYSEEEHKTKQGDWGWIDRKTLRKELSDVAFRLRPGQHSHVISAEEGYYVLQVYDFKKGQILPLSQIRDQIETTLVNEERQRLQQKWIDTLKAKAFIKMF